MTFNNVIWLVDAFIQDGIEFNDLKSGVNKVLNVFFNPLNKAVLDKPVELGFLDFLAKNNQVLDEKLKLLKTDNKAVNANPSLPELRQKILHRFSDIQTLEKQYVIK